MTGNSFAAPNVQQNACSVIQDLTHQSQSKQSILLFLDIDGTLADFCINPDDVVIEPIILNTIAQLMKYDVEVCIVTGRSVRSARRLFGTLPLPILGTHGLEWQLHSHDNAENQLDSEMQRQLEVIKSAVVEAAAAYPELMIEDKAYSVAIHYRCCPALQDYADTIATTIVSSFSDWQLKAGKYVIEIAPAKADKGLAIARYMAQVSDKPYAIFIGDDVTDENGFAAVQHAGGCGIKVGSGVTSAYYRVADVAAIAEVLDALLRWRMEND